MGSIHLLVSFLLLVSTTLADQDINERVYSYNNSSKTSPDHWGEIRQDWAICGKGKLQSPIDMSHKLLRVLPSLGKLRRSYRPANASMKNLGHDIMIKWEEDAGEIQIDRKAYALKKIHWHTPSEHTINGRRYSLEIHMVHQSTDGKLAVVAVIYTIGRPDTFLAEMEEYLKMAKGTKEGEEVRMEAVDPRNVKRGSRKYYRYIGSLTIPPCTEGVIWTIVNKVRTVSREQVKLLKEAVHDGFGVNARPTQLINQRTIEMYRPSV